MLHSFRHMIAAAVATLALVTSSALAGDELCSLAPGTYASAKQAHPDAAFAIAELEKHSIATWYSDRSGDYASTAKQLVSQCPESSRLSVVVYGLPNKDCDAGYSNGGSNKNAGDYAQYLNTLASTIGSRKVLYVLEPDAVGLLAKTGGCAEASGYKSNLQAAVKILSANPNAEIYLDVGYWTLQYSEQAAKVAAIVRDVAAAGRVKGITLNTSNYRSNAELANLCGTFQRAVGNGNMRCVFDTSRNYNGAPASSEWCNTRSAGIGKVPTAATGLSNVDYFIWIKPPGESDGTCDGGDRTTDALKGPTAGAFFADSFKLLWNQGALVKEMGMPAIDGSVRQHSTTTPAPAQITAAPTQAPTQEPTPTPAPTETEAPETLAPASTVGSPVQQDRSIADSSATSSAAGSAAAGNSTDTASATTTTSTVAADAVTSALDVPETATAENSAAATVNATPAAATTSDDPATSAGDNVQQVSNKSGGESPMGTGVIVLIGMIGAAVVALVAVVGLRRRQQKMLDEAKTPTEPYPSYQITTTTSHDSSVL